MNAASPNNRPRTRGPYIQEARGSHVDEQYPVMVRNNRLRAGDLARLRYEASRFGYRPLVSILLPVYEADRKRLERALDSVLGQVYPNWELCVCDGGSGKKHVSGTLSRYEALDNRMKVRRLEVDEGAFRAVSVALSMSGGEFAGLLGQDDVLAPDALFEVVRLLQERAGADLVYSDSDSIDGRRERSSPHFKPGWSPDLLLSTNYIGRPAIFRKGLAEEAGGFREAFEGAQDYDLLLRLTERTGEIHHVPKVLYHRGTEGSPGREDRSAENSRRALSEALERRGVEGPVEDGLLPGSFRVKRSVSGEPLVSIVIPTRDNVSLLRNCVESVGRHTDYRNYEILILDNDSADPETVEYLASTHHRVLPFREPFNYSRINNFGVSEARGEYVLLLNDDTEAVSGGWLEEMLRHAQRPDVGAVGARLLYPNDRIQHAGVVMGVGNPWNASVATHAYQHYPADFPGHGGTAMMTTNYSGVTAACMMLRKSVFTGLGGLNEGELRVAFNDVDLCLRIREKGYSIVYTPYAELYHHESASRGYGGDPAEVLYMREKWGEVLDNDPFYNPHFSTGGAEFNLRADLLRPRRLQEEARQSQDYLENSYKSPLTMGQEELQRQREAQLRGARDSRRITLIPDSGQEQVERGLLKARAGGQPGQADGQEAAPPARTARQADRSGTAPPPFFVIGQPKSGTTWIRSTLDTHPEITCLGEGKFFGRDFRTANPSSGGKLPSLYSLFSDSEDLQVWSRAVGPWIVKSSDRKVRQRELERHMKGLTRAAIDYFLEDARAKYGTPIVGDKTPAHTAYLEEISELYPDARIVHIIRDGRDQAVSSVFHWWKEADKAQFSNLDPEILEKKAAYYKEKSSFGSGGQSIFVEDALRGLARGWKENVLKAMELGPRLFGEHYLETKYEDLLLNPEPLFEKIFSLLGASTENGIVEECVRKNSFEARTKSRKRGTEDPGSFYRKGIAGDWANHFTQRDKKIFKESAGDLLIQLGYEKDLNW